MSHSSPMSIDHPMQKRKLAFTCNFTEITYEVAAQPIVHENKRCKLNPDQDETEEMQISQAPFQGYKLHATKLASANCLFVKIPSKSEITDVLKKEAFMRHRYSLLKREKENYLAQLKEYNKPFCGTFGSTDSCDDSPLTSKKDI